MPDDIQLPTALSGVITNLDGVRFCMDGATHLIHTLTGATRLKGRNDEVASILAKYADGKTKLTVMGYLTWGAECRYLSVYHVALAKDVNQVLAGDDIFPWPWIAND